jgi:hypothetical protein
MNLEKNDDQDHLEIFDESRTLEVVGNEEKDECILILKTPQLIKKIVFLSSQ